MSINQERESRAAVYGLVRLLDYSKIRERKKKIDLVIAFETVPGPRDNGDAGALGNNCGANLVTQGKHGSARGTHKDNTFLGECICINISLVS